jgi:hypothetical protein
LSGKARSRVIPSSRELSPRAGFLSFMLVPGWFLTNQAHEWAFKIEGEATACLANQAHEQAFYLAPPPSIDPSRKLSLRAGLFNAIIDASMWLHRECLVNRAHERAS